MRGDVHGRRAREVGEAGVGPFFFWGLHLACARRAFLRRYLRARPLVAGFAIDTAIMWRSSEQTQQDQPVRAHGGAGLQPPNYEHITQARRLETAPVGRSGSAEG